MKVRERKRLACVGGEQRRSGCSQEFLQLSVTAIRHPSGSVWKAVLKSDISLNDFALVVPLDGSCSHLHTELVGKNSTILRPRFEDGSFFSDLARRY